MKILGKRQDAHFISFIVRTGNRARSENIPMTTNIYLKSINKSPTIIIVELKKNEAGRAILNTLKTDESLAEIVLNK